MASAQPKKSSSFSDFEREAIQNRAKELAADAKAGRSKAQGEQDVQAVIAKMSSPDKEMAQKIHTLVKESAPSLSPKTWYGMPAYANGEGKVVCFFQAAEKFKVRYATLGFNDAAKLDQGKMWPTAFAIVQLTAAQEQQIRQLIQMAVA